MKIKPCWNCGLVPEVRPNPPLVGGFYGNYQVYCADHCDTTSDGEPKVTAFGATREAAIENWNMRCEMEEDGVFQ